MLTTKLLIVACLALPGQSSADDNAPRPEMLGDGSISGVVVNASRNAAPVAGAEVLLRMNIDGVFVPLAKTIADPQGRFAFRDLMLGPQFLYMPAANHDGVHYPGERIELSRSFRQATARVTVHDTSAEPNPLVIRRQEIVLRPESGALRVSESILIDNPTAKTYVGKSAGNDADPVTYTLNIPPDFDRATFDKEFFGREFSVVKGKVVTDIPWTPGQQEVKLTYVLPNTESHRLWQRPLDLPCQQVSVRVENAKPDEVACNLASTATERREDRTELTFASQGETLPAGHVIRIELGQLPVPWMVWARWLAVVALIHLIVGGSLIARRRQNRLKRSQAAAGKTSASHAGPSSGPHLGRSRRNGKHKKSAGRRAAND